MIAMARMNIPAIFVYGGTIKPGRLNGEDLTVVSAFEAVGQYSAGKIDEAQLTAVEKKMLVRVLALVVVCLRLIPCLLLLRPWA